MGAAMALTAFDVVKNKRPTTDSLDEFENKVVTAGLLKITPTTNGATYEVTENGKRFLREYAFLSEKMRKEASAPLPVQQ